MIEFQKLLEGLHENVQEIEAISKNVLFPDQLKLILEMNQEMATKFVTGLKYVFVGDNPGEIEMNGKNFFSGDSGETLKLFIRKFLNINIEEIPTKVLFMNKSFVHTKYTAQLEELDISSSFMDLFEKNQQIIAFLLEEIIKLNKNVYICLLGVDTIRRKKDNSFEKNAFNPFYTQYFSNDKTNNTLLFYHPSRRRPITIDQTKRLDEEFVTKSFNEQEKKEKKEQVFIQYGKNELEKRLKFADDTFDNALKSVLAN